MVDVSSVGTLQKDEVTLSLYMLAWAEVSGDTIENTIL